MAKRKPKPRPGSGKQTAVAVGLLFCVILVVLGISVGVYLSTGPELDEVTLCAPEPSSTTVLIVDVTDPMTAPQRQDLANQLERMKASIERGGKLIVFKVDATSDQLLQPIITRCNPGTAADVNELNGNPEAVQRLWDEQYTAPLDAAFRTLTAATGSSTSPILESIQSAALTELQRPTAEGKPKRLIVVSDLLQNTPSLSFYTSVPSARDIVSSPAFRVARTDLRGVDVELWMLQRPDAFETQPRALADLWDALIAEQNGRVLRLYNVSG